MRNTFEEKPAFYRTAARGLTHIAIEMILVMLCLTACNSAASNNTPTPMNSYAITGVAVVYVGKCLAPPDQTGTIDDNVLRTFVNQGEFAVAPGRRVIEGRGLYLMRCLVDAHVHFSVFDQRGVGLSEPALECPEWLQAAYDQLDEPDVEISSKVMFEVLTACYDRLVREGVNLSNYNTVQNAADVNAIRIALGYDQLNLFGRSYGTLLAQAVMRDHPSAVRSVLLASVLPLEKSFFVDVSTTAAKAVLRLLEACATEDACDATYPDLKDVLFKTIDDLNANPVPITVTNPVNGKTYPVVLTGDAVFGNLVGFLYRTDLIPVLPRAIYDVSEGNNGVITQLMGVNLANYGATSRGMMFSVFCADDLIGRTEQEYLDNRAALPEQLLSRTRPDLTAKYGPFATCRMWSVEQATPLGQAAPGQRHSDFGVGRRIRSGDAARMG